MSSNIDPGFFEPLPVKAIFVKKNKNGKNYIPNILGKRKLVDAFGEKIYNDEERYGQEIPADFFQTNIGHGVYK